MILQKGSINCERFVVVRLRVVDGVRQGFQSVARMPAVTGVGHVREPVTCPRFLYQGL